MKTNRWIDFDFANEGWSTTHENRSDAFAQFVKDFRSDMKSMLKDSGWEVKTLKGNWFDVNGFVFNKTHNIYVYFSTGDVRFLSGWSCYILCRTAENEKDFTGGMNRDIRFDEFWKYLGQLTGRVKVIS
jgi:hypothetical protein